MKLQGLLNEKFNEEKLYAGFVEHFPTLGPSDSWLSEIEDIVKEYE